MTRVHLSGCRIWKLFSKSYLRETMVVLNLVTPFVDSSAEILANLFEIYSHLLSIRDISPRALCTILDSISSLLRIRLEDNDYEHIIPYLCEFLDCLFTIQCGQYRPYDEESALYRVFEFYKTIFSSSCWQFIGGETLWSIIYSLYAVYSQVRFRET